MVPNSEPANELAPAIRKRLYQAVGAAVGEVFPAITLAVIHHGDFVFEAAWGWIDPEERNLPVALSTPFDLASVSKLFTTTAFLSMVSAGKVNLDDPLVSIIPKFGQGGLRGLDGGQDPHTRAMLPVPDEVVGKTVDPDQITFRHLLTHTSGMAPWRAVFQAAGPTPPPPDEQDEFSIDLRHQNALTAICGYPFVAQPGELIRYSDLGLMLVGETVARLHGDPLNVAVRQRVIEPLGLASPVYNPLQNGCDRQMIAPTEYDATWRGRRCWGEVHDENACGLGGVAGHAGLFANVRDVANLGQAWLERDSRLKIVPELMALATTEQVSSQGERRGLGWLLKSHTDSPAGERLSAAAYGHTGFTGTSLWIDPERALVIACLTNRVYDGREKIGIHGFRRTIHDILAEGLEKR
ncbi:MAG: serine hydrolase [Anaerolineae bacterium]|nr:serine hydrolase [Anaerolineae bacterium]